uniref:Serine protease K12H4.7 n=1 Tax=Magallana gigas TaxID=29159 RepID=A0A8W8IVI8_MAGGI
MIFPNIGYLSAWFRVKYPHLVDGAVATSAPIFAQLNFKEYLQVVVSSLATTGPGCNKNIKMATDTITKMISTDTGRKSVEKMFNLCDPLDTSQYVDGSNLFSNLAGNFEGVVQYNKDNRAFEGAIGTNITIDTICGIMTDESNGSPVERYAKVNSLMLSTYSQKCLDNSYNKMIKGLQATAWNASASEGDLGDVQPFGNFFNLKFSIQQYLSAESPAIYIQGTAHCANMYPGTSDDLPQLVQARAIIEKLIGTWISSN